ncbi:alpha/beta hydrolase [Aliidiomarina minuta]|uniref:Alpha/beta hydrolase n=1 Tax=Aliidiomarina minuta TaxID=880057 RepID=A0A432W847_9GAMM|nr:alpha/beta hydrolase [Aliidiomarina minuta]RUO26191.1 alpha/beta hydrolase [Aliidiomarina minuta]
MTAVVCLHSSQSSGAQWRPLLRFFREQKVDIVSPDLIGYGACPQAAPEDSQAFRLADEVSMLSEHCESFARRPLHLVGHSYGAALALKIAKDNPAQVASLTLYEPVSFHVLADDDPAREQISGVSANMESLSEEESARLFVDYWNYPGYFDALPERVQRVMLGQQKKVLADFAALLGEPAQLQDYAAVQCPVLLMHGDASPLSSRRVAQLLGQTLPQCTELSINGGHMAPVTDPASVMPAMTDFLLQQLAIE